MYVHTHTHTDGGETGEKRAWGSCENIASRYQKRLERKYGAIFYSSLPVRVSKESPVQQAFIVHTRINTLALHSGVTEWVLNICLVPDSKQLVVDYSCIPFFFGQFTLWPHSHSNINKWFHLWNCGKLWIFWCLFGTGYTTKKSFKICWFICYGHNLAIATDSFSAFPPP